MPKPVNRFAPEDPVKVPRPSRPGAKFRHYQDAEIVTQEPDGGYKVNYVFGSFRSGPVVISAEDASKIKRRRVKAAERKDEHVPASDVSIVVVKPRDPVVWNCGPAVLIEQPKSFARIEDADYLTWIRHKDCAWCKPGEQVTPTEASHYGPTGWDLKTHDWLSHPACHICHQVWWHGKGHLPGMDPCESHCAMLSVEIDLILIRFGDKLGEASARWECLADVGKAMPIGEPKETYLTHTAMLLVEHVGRVTGRL